jgi:hypothetical protein
MHWIDPDWRGWRGGDATISMTHSRQPVQPGEPAPDFEVASVHREGTVSLADYRGRSPLFLALYRGLY